MKFVASDVIPKERRSKKKLYNFLNEFIDSDLASARIIPDDKDYKNSYSCYKCLYNAAARYNMNVAVLLRRGDVYLVRKTSFGGKEND